MREGKREERRGKERKGNNEIKKEKRERERERDDDDENEVKKGRN